MSTQEESNLIVFVTEEYSYLCYVMILQGTSPGADQGVVAGEEGVLQRPVARRGATFRHPLEAGLEPGGRVDPCGRNLAAGERCLSPARQEGPHL